MNTSSRKIVVNPSFIEARKKRQSIPKRKKKTIPLWPEMIFPVLVCAALFVILFLISSATKKPFSGIIMVIWTVSSIFFIFIYYLGVRIIYWLTGSVGEAVKLRPPNLFCADCGKHMDNELNWICGYCDQEIDPLGISFLGKCHGCKRFAMSIECSHCHVLNAFKEGADPRHAAYAIPKPKEEAAPSASLDEEEIHQKKKRKIQKEAELARERKLRNQEIAEERLTEMAAKGPEEKSLVDDFEEAFSRGEASHLLLDEIRARKRSQAEQLPSPQREKRLQLIETIYDALLIKQNLK